MAVTDDGALSDQPRVFAFVFPMASGHVNPSLPIARALVALGHEVHYLCREQMREAIEDTGAKFHSDVDVETELYRNREADVTGALGSLKTEKGLDNDNWLEVRMKLGVFQLELKLIGTVRWLRALAASAMLYCPLMSAEGAYAAKVVGIPSVALITTAGPGSVTRSYAGVFDMMGMTQAQLLEISESYKPNVDAVLRINQLYGLDLPFAPNMDPVGRLNALKHSLVSLSTTCEDLQDPMMPEVVDAYEKDGVLFEAVGPLFDGDGAKRAAGHKFKDAVAEAVDGRDPSGYVDEAHILSEVRLAKSAGRAVVLVSMGTVLTGDDPSLGWEGRVTGPDGKKRGLTGRELCRAAWAGAFDAFGTDGACEGPLIVLALGPQRDALGELRPPANALCVPRFPQVDILRLGVDVFLTNGGQNSFTEALSSAVPVVVCEGIGDQVLNARKAEHLGVGMRVVRPDPDQGSEVDAVTQYRAEVTQVLKLVFAEKSFGEAAAQCASRLQKAGRVPRAVEWMLAAAAGRSALPL